MNKFFKYFPRAVASIILIETLLFKFGVGGEIFLKESQTLFENLTTGIFGHPEYEAYFRIGVGVLELIVAIVILTPRYAGIGALLGLILMLAAVTSHVFLIGIIVGNDGGQLMVMALIVMMCCVKVILDERIYIRSVFSNNIISQ
jgi:hypothetical protein